ncbi:hypothetical protein YC2023_107909 [Brassica napus]
MLSIFHSFKDLEDFWDDLPVSHVKYNALDDFQEVFQTTSRKYSRRLPGSLPDDFQEVFQTTSRFSDLDLDMQVFQIWKTSGLQDFQTTSRKSSRRLPGSLPDDFQEVFSRSLLPCLSFITDMSVLDFNQMVLIFHFDIYGLPASLPHDFKEVFHTTSRKSSRRFLGSVPDDFLEIFQTTSCKSSNGVFFHIKWCLSLSL